MSTLRNVLVGVFLLLLVAFVILNWAALSAAQDISLGFRSVEAPLGLFLLGVLVVGFVLFAVYAVGLRTSSLMEYRRSSKELDAARRLADESEASRFGELRAYIETELASLAERVAEEGITTRERLDRTENILQAYLGEIDEYLKRDGGDAGGEEPPGP